MLHALELLERDLGVFDVLDRRRVLAHLLDEALGRGDGIPDLVRDARGQLVDARLLLGLHGGALASELALDRRVEVPLPQHVGAEDGHPVRKDADAPPERRPDEPGIAGGEEVDEREKGDDAEVAHQVRVEAGFSGRAPARAAKGLLLRRARLRRLRAVSPPLPACLPSCLARRAYRLPTRAPLPGSPRVVPSAAARPTLTDPHPVVPEAATEVAEQEARHQEAEERHESPPTQRACQIVGRCRRPEKVGPRSRPLHAATCAGDARPQSGRCGRAV